MLFFRKRQRERGPLPPGLRLYAIGDLHGRADLLERLHAEIAEELEASPPERALLVYLGDYLDRGFGSAEVLEQLLAPPSRGWSGSSSRATTRRWPSPSWRTRWGRPPGLSLGGGRPS